MSIRVKFPEEGPLCHDTCGCLLGSNDAEQKYVFMSDMQALQYAYQTNFALQVLLMAMSSSLLHSSAGCLFLLDAQDISLFTEGKAYRCKWVHLYNL